MSEQKAKIAYWAGEQFWGCVYDKVSTPGMWGFSRCSNKAKYDPDADGNPTHCGVHCEAAVERRAEKQEQRTADSLKKWAAKDRQRKFQNDCVTAVRSIAAGHNDPRGLAQSIIDEAEE